ncbi:HAD family hydrolase [Pseudorhodoplanes sinuspersici]|nr:HAD family hydrolase [Pseudorhodoplanes sinuspersici]RKE68413.1 2-haloacid dehalogenase/putative hydrolase of the HAD superfamily [Pseudorhodoplanes sinuspersici]
MLDFDSFKVLTFDCYGTLIDWETGMEELVRPWMAELGGATPLDLVITSFALHQAKHQQVRPALLYPELLARTWHDIEGTFGWEKNESRAKAFAESVGHWPPFADTVGSLRYLSRFYKLAILSNVDNSSLTRTLRLLEVPFVLTVTAEDVGSYKPGLPHFTRALEELERQGFAKDDILHVAQSKHHDVMPGRQLGLSTIWVNRRHNRKGSGATLATEAEPDLAVTSLAELVVLHKARSRFAAVG